MKQRDKVVYIMRTLIDVGLINNKEYIIESVAECGGCEDNLCIDVGIKADPIVPFIYCPFCNTIISIDDRWMFHNSGFRLVEENPASFSYIKEKLFNQ